MGTKVHHKSDLPGCYTMRDLEKDVGNGWLFCYEDRTLNGKLYNDFTPRPTNGYTEYDKEVLRQTMLRHEEIFKEQVCELHRLYRIQRNLMDELNRKEEHTFCVQVNSSGSSPFSIKMLPKDREKAWQGHGFPSANVSYRRTAVSGINNAQAHSKFLNGSNFQSGVVLKENGGSAVFKELTDSNVRKFPRRKLDLQLPADAYIDDGDAEHAEENFIKPVFETAHPTNINFGFLPEDDAKLSLDTSQNHGSRNETQKSGSHILNGLHPHSLVDLNEPLTEVNCEDVIVSSCNFAIQTTHCKGLQEHQNSIRSASEFPGFRKSFVQDTYKCGGSISMNVGRGEGWNHPLFKNEFGQSSNHENCFTSNVSNTNVGQCSEHIEIQTKDAHYFPSILSLKQHKTEAWFREKRTQSIEPSDSTYIANTKYSGLTVPTMSVPFSALPQTENERSASSTFSISINHTPVAVQALPCFSELTMNIQSTSSSTSSQNFGNACEKWQYNHGSRLTLNKGGETCFRPNGFHHSFQSESSVSSHVYLPSVTFHKRNLNNSASSAYAKPEDHGPQNYLKGLHDTNVKIANDMNVDVAAPSGFQIEYAPEWKTLGDLQERRESTLGGRSWLRRKSPCSGLLNLNNGVCQEEQGAEEGYSPLMLNYLPRYETVEKKEIENIPSLEVLPLTLEAKATIVQQNEASNTSKSKKILGFPMPLETQYSPAGNVNKGVKEKSLHTDTSFRSKLLDLEKQMHTELDLGKSVGKCSNVPMDHLSFNSNATIMDQPKSSEHSSKDEAQLPSTLSVQCTSPRFASEIDLEAPIPCLSEEQMPSAESVLDLNQLVSPAEPESKRDTPQATAIGDETIGRLAAEIIRTISMGKHIHPDGLARCVPPPASVDMLTWFADMVTSNSDDLEAARDEEQGSSDIDGIDYFEYMTLNLKEVKVDEYCSNPMEIENPKEEETGVAHLLLTKPRRGRARRRRQRRDFQKDILPGLATLSRHEVSEDLQIIGRLMRASGLSWQAGGSRRNNSRNRSHSQTRGRGRRRRRGTSAAAAAVAEIPLDPHPSQPSNAEVAIDGRSILGWGRTTRRCWRQRCSSGNILVPAPT